MTAGITQIVGQRMKLKSNGIALWLDTKRAPQHLPTMQIARTFLLAMRFEHSVRYFEASREQQNAAAERRHPGRTSRAMNQSDPAFTKDWRRLAQGFLSTNGDAPQIAEMDIQIAGMKRKCGRNGLPNPFR